MDDFITFIYVTSMLVTAVLTTLGTTEGELKIKKKYPDIKDKAVTRLVILSNAVTVFMPVFNTGMVFFAAWLVLKKVKERS